jgi:hypothetical protein
MSALLISAFDVHQDQHAVLLAFSDDAADAGDVGAVDVGRSHLRRRLDAVSHRQLHHVGHRVDHRTDRRARARSARSRP